MQFTNTKIFQNRQDAGHQLAEALREYNKFQPIVLGMPRGGVVVAAEVAKVLQAPLDVMVARKVGAPMQPEYAIGAVAPGNIRALNSEALTMLGVNECELEALIVAEQKELERRIKLYRGSKPPLDVKNRMVILVDDGIATGQTAIAAVRALRQLEPQKIIVAAPVSASDALQLLQQEADEVVCIAVPDFFHAVGQWYQEFGQTTDAEVIALLKD